MNHPVQIPPGRSENDLELSTAPAPFRSEKANPWFVRIS